MDKESVYTSTGIKYHRACQVFESLRQGIGRPQSLQVSLTNRCNLSCVFCSVAERDLKQEWDYVELRKAIDSFISVGIKTIEFSGGGEPTLYPDFKQVVSSCYSRGLKIGLITNGLRLIDYQDILSFFTWIRISMIALDYQDEIDLPEFPLNVTIGMSYVVGQKVYGNDHRRYKEMDVLNRIKEYAKRYNADFVRLVPDCHSDKDEMLELHKYYDKLCNELGHPFFFQHKMPEQAKICYLDSVKPWLEVDGYVYPCNAISLQADSLFSFYPKYRICHWTEIEKYYRNRGNQSLKTDSCNYCVFTNNNEIISELILPIKHEDFL